MTRVTDETPEGYWLYAGGHHFALMHGSETVATVRCSPAYPSGDRRAAVAVALNEVAAGLNRRAGRGAG